MTGSHDDAALSDSPRTRPPFPTNDLHRPPAVHFGCCTVDHAPYSLQIQHPTNDIRSTSSSIIRNGSSDFQVLLRGEAESRRLGHDEYRREPDKIQQHICCEQPERDACGIRHEASLEWDHTWEWWCPGWAGQGGSWISIEGVWQSAVSEKVRLGQKHRETSRGILMVKQGT